MPYKVVQGSGGWLLVNVRTHKVRQHFPTKEQALRARRIANDRERKDKKQ